MDDQVKHCGAFDHRHETNSRKYVYPDLKALPGQRRAERGPLRPANAGLASKVLSCRHLVTPAC